ncbi:MAG: hypothetical protein IJ213_08210 [Bacteroidales bacterium]|nr:hypothetical protein [Bacteroidales bacterium]
MRKKTHLKKKKNISLKIILSSKDTLLLERYAKLNSMSEKTAAKKILKEYLAANVTLPKDESENQLSLFAPRETDIFDFIR